MKIVELANKYHIKHRHWDEAIQEAEAYEKIVEWASRQKCLHQKGYMKFQIGEDCGKCEICLARKLMSQICSEGKEGKP
jgi:hypothetical protein